MGSPSFDIGYGGAEPLDMSNLGPAPQQQPSQPMDPEQRKSWLRLAMILPLAMKGGPGAMEGFLGGLNQAEQQRQVQQRQTMQDQQRQAQVDATTRAQQATITGQQDTRRQQLLKDYVERLNAATSPEEVQAIRQLYGQQAQSLGMRPGALEPYAASLTPDTFTARKIQKTWASLPTESKSEALKNGWTLNVGDQQVPFEQWSAVIGGVVDPKTGRPPVSTPKVDVPNTPEEQFYQQFATENGAASFAALPTAKQQQARKQWMQADDRPQPQATILIQTVDEQGNPVQRLVPRTPGTTFATAPTAGQATAMAEQEAGIALIGQIEQLYQPGLVGPVVGRMTQAQMQIPGAPDVSPEVAEFYAAVAGLRNEIIRLMSGAAVSGAEEQRMRSQLPDVTDKPNVFTSKLKQTRANREMLAQRLRARSGQPGAQQPQTSQTPPAAAGTPTRIGRFDVVVEP